MIRWTTPTIKCTIPSDLPLTYLNLIIKQNNISVEKTIMADEVVDGVFYVTYDQKETSAFEVGRAKVQVNIMNGNKRLATCKVDIEVTENLKDELMDEML